MKKTRIMTLVAMTALSVSLMAVPVSAAGAEVTKGDFATFAGGEGQYEIEGRAHMVRTPGSTVVVVVARGLVPDVTYGSHVHNQPCAIGDAGGHYSFGFPVPGGDQPNESEIWPGPFTANSSGRITGKAWVGVPAGPDAVSVVIHAPDGSKIACADLS